MHKEQYQLYRYRKDWLQEHGGYCDCEILANIEDIVDTDFSVRMAIVRNNKLPIDLLKKMIRDNESEIADEAMDLLKNKQ